MQRKSYEKGELSKASVNINPLQQFRTWFYETKDAGGVDEVNAMTLTTVDAEGFPRGRVVLLKKYDEYGFYFYTNYISDKARSLALNNKVSLSFFWWGAVSVPKKNFALPLTAIFTSAFL